MSYLNLMTNDDIQYVCSVIPTKIASDYFRQNPKSFAKICPGFRPNAISHINVGDLLYRNYKTGFVSSFLEKIISMWLSQINEYLDKCLREDMGKDVAYIRTLAQSYFGENIALYFKLIEEHESEIYISLLSSAVTEAKITLEEKERLKRDVDTKVAKITRLQTDLESKAATLNETETKQNEYAIEIQSLKQKLAKADALAAMIQSNEETITILEDEIDKLKKSEENLKSEIKTILNDQKLHEARISEKIEEQRVEMVTSQADILKPLRPTNMDEFKEYLGYNLKDIGADTPTESYSLLKEYLSNILFQGMPIIINRRTGVPLMKCIANTLVENANVPTLTYNKKTTAEDIEMFLSKGTRVVCLNGFLGNYNETVLLNKIERHKNKIIFLTLAYDRTLQYIPYEIFRYCHYLNLNRIQTLSLNADITEDPSIIEECEADILAVDPDVRFSALLKDILEELNLSPSLIPHKCSRISNEQDLCCSLIFDILPYCTDVKQIAPFTISERLVKYAGDTGRSIYKSLFKEWFA